MSGAPHDTRSGKSTFTTQRYAGFAKGMNNILADVELPADQLRNAVNVDVLDSGKLRRRAGKTQIASGRAHSLWSNGSLALVFHAGALKQINPSLSLTTLADNLADRPISYTEAGLDVYWSNGSDYGRISGGANQPWGVEVPTVAPALVASSGGALPAGSYQGAVTFVTATGEESAASNVGATDVTAGTLTITVPQPTEPQVTGIRLYLTAPNGELFCAIVEVAVGVLTYAVVGLPVYGRELKTQFMARMIPCDIIAHWRGHIFGASGNTLWHTEPYAFGLMRPAANYHQFPTDIRLVVPVTTGIYVVCDKTYWMGHQSHVTGGMGVQTVGVHEVAPYSAALRSSCSIPDSPDMMWFTDRGLVLARENGKLELLQIDNVFPGAYNNGAVFIREKDSIRQVVASVQNPHTGSELAAQDWMEAEIVRSARS